MLKHSPYQEINVPLHLHCIISATYHGNWEYLQLGVGDILEFDPNEWQSTPCISSEGESVGLKCELEFVCIGIIVFSLWVVVVVQVGSQSLETRPHVKQWETERLRAEGSRLGGQSLGEEVSRLQEPTCTATEQWWNSAHYQTVSCQINNTRYSSVLVQVMFSLSINEAIGQTAMNTVTYPSWDPLTKCSSLISFTQSIDALEEEDGTCW